MSFLFECVNDDVCPDKIKEAGERGELQVQSVIGWISIDAEDFTGVKNGCVYKVEI